MTKTKDLSSSNASLSTFEGYIVHFFVCFIKGLFEVSYDKVNKVHLHPVELKQFRKDPSDDILLSTSKNKKC